MLTNRQFARYTAQIAKRASSWTHDTMTMGDHHWDGPTINNSAERFCKEIEEVIGWMRAEAGLRTEVAQPVDDASGSYCGTGSAYYSGREPR